jgi:hypothetical protein
MSGNDNWLKDLAALAASSPQISELAPLEVGFEVDGRKMGLDLTQGRITDGSSAQCLIVASADVFADLVCGAVTLQRAHVSGRVQLSGEPEKTPFQTSAPRLRLLRGVVGSRVGYPALPKAGCCGCGCGCGCGSGFGSGFSLGFAQRRLKAQVCADNALLCHNLTMPKCCCHAFVSHFLRTLPKPVVARGV